MNLTIKRLSMLARSLRKHPYQLTAYLSLIDDPYYGSVSEVEFEELIGLAAKSKEVGGDLVEIGTLFGFSTQALALGKGQDQSLVTVDDFSWNPLGIPPRTHEMLTTMNLEHLRRTSGVTLLNCGQGTSLADYWSGRDAPALVFIDADHSYDAVKADIAWAQSVNAGIICGHDYFDAFPGVMRAVDEAFGDKIRVVDTLWSHGGFADASETRA